MGTEREREKERRWRESDVVLMKAMGMWMDRMDCKKQNGHN